MSNMVHPSDPHPKPAVIPAAEEELKAGCIGPDGVCACPHCGRSFRMENARSMLICKRCGYRWNSRLDEPSKCPKCGSYAWNKPVKECKCNVCGYIWVSRKGGIPSRCPNCRSNRWDKLVETPKKIVVEESPEEVNARWIMERYQSGQGCVEIASALGLPVFHVMNVVKLATGSKVLPKI